MVYENFGQEKKIDIRGEKKERRKLENTSTAEPSTKPGIRY